VIRFLVRHSAGFGHINWWRQKPTAMQQTTESTIVRDHEGRARFSMIQTTWVNSLSAVLPG